MTGREIIEDACRQIMEALKSGTFTKEDLEFLIRFFEELARISREKLQK